MTLATPHLVTKVLALLPARTRVWLLLLRRVAGMTLWDQARLWVSAVVDNVGPWTVETPSAQWDLTVRARRSGILFRVRRHTDDLYHALPKREGDVESTVLDGLSQGDVFIDTGANIGFYALHAAKAVGPGGRVIAIEGQPETCDVLKANVALNGITNVEVTPAAVTEQTGDVVSFMVQGRRFGTATARMADAHAARMRIPTIALDDVAQHISRVHMLKLDIEGGELSALRGARQLLGRVDQVVVECNQDADEILALLRNHGFAVERLKFTVHYVARRKGGHVDS